MAESQPKPRLIDPQKRIILPPEVLLELGVKVGDYVGFELEGGVVRLRRVEWVMR